MLCRECNVKCGDGNARCDDDLTRDKSSLGNKSLKMVKVNAMCWNKGCFTNIPLKF